MHTVKEKDALLSWSETSKGRDDEEVYRADDSRYDCKPFPCT